jgi:plasmid stabilization system protein ParE
VTEVRVAPDAEAQIQAIDAWWLANRPSAPHLFREELAAGLELIASAPAIGRRQPRTGIAELRRILLRSTRNHVYYVPSPLAEVLVVVAVWNAHRGSGPDLGSLSVRR